MTNLTGNQEAAKVESKEEVQTILQGDLNTSQKIRALNAMGLQTMTISILLEKRYQHVRNVLMTRLTGK